MRSIHHIPTVSDWFQTSVQYALLAVGSDGACPRSG